MNDQTAAYSSAASVLGNVILGLTGLIAAFWWLGTNQRPLNFGWIFAAAGVVWLVYTWKKYPDPRLAIRYKLTPSRVVSELVHTWKPVAGESEADYEKSLHNFLLKNLSWFVKVTRQYGTGRVKCDLATGHEVMIELKLGFTSPSTLQRLIGQVDQYRREWGKPVIVVLVGEAHDDLLHDLHQSVSKYEGVEVITKRAKAA